jgi:DNA-binding NtrC family response regulator
VRGAFTGAVRDKSGLFEAASGGTLFLDEVTELPLATQAKLLRVVEEQAIRRVGAVRATSVDCRILCATNRDLQRDMAEGRFRPDLGARLAEAEIALPGLADRVEDLPLLVEHLGRRAGCRVVLDVDALEALACHAWPLNVRELDNVVRTLGVLGGGQVVRLAMLPPQLQLLSAGAGETLVAPRRGREERVLEVLQRNEGNVRRTSQEMGVSRSYIYRCLDRQGLRLSELRDGVPVAAISTAATRVGPRCASAEGE